MALYIFSLLEQCDIFFDAGIMSNITNMENNTESFRTHKQKPACLFVSCNHYYIEIFSDKLDISRYPKFGFGFLEMPSRNGFF